MNLEVLITTMHQNDFSKINEMNIESNSIIANQTNFNKYEEKIINDKVIKMISTKTRGLSKNRNIALVFSNAEYVLFADDDMKFIPGYEELIEKEFKAIKNAEAIKFYVENINSNRKLSWNRPGSIKKATRKNISSAGVVALVIKTEILKKHCLFFNEKFGSGTENYCGEDTIFLQELVNKKINFYISPTKISNISQGKSSWFEGYNEKYFQIVGKVLGTIYPILSYFIILRSSYKFNKNKECNLNFRKILKNYFIGIRNK